MQGYSIRQGTAVVARCSLRRYSAQPASDLKAVMRELVPEKRQKFMDFKKAHSDTVIGEVKVQNLIGGMRGLKAMLWEVKLLPRI